MMKVEDSQNVYRQQIKAYQDRKASVSKQMQTVRSRMENLPDGHVKYEEEAATLELTLKELDEKQGEFQEYMDKLAGQYCEYWNAAVDQKADASEERIEDMGKILEVARRIMRGAIVPAADEKKLMEFSSDMYQMAKNIGAMVQRRKREKYDSLWEDEEEKENGDSRNSAGNTAIYAGASAVGPEAAADSAILTESEVF